LQKSDDLKTNACTTDSGLPPHVKAIFPLLADEVIARYYGCGIVVPELLDGCSVLDLGCGAGISKIQ
jgi:arsenite methyltransferase